MIRLIRIFLYIFLVLCISLKESFSNLQFSESMLVNTLIRYGKDGYNRVLEWQTLTQETQQVSIEDKLYSVNHFFNKIRFVNDIDHWNVKDYWATPVEFLGTNAGDCEDFVIAKYFTLIHLGVSPDKLRLMYVTATRPKRQAHMVLAYYPSPGEVPFILDNIQKRILPATSRRDLIPIYSFNADGLWLAKEQGRGRKVQGKNNNSLWKDLNSRMLKGE